MLLKILAVCVFLATAAVLLSGWHLLMVWLRHRRGKDEYVMLAISVGKLNEKLPIVAEQLFAVLHGSGQQISWWDWLRGCEPENLSFEIANTDGMIRFYAFVPKHLQGFVEGQIYAQYPDVEIMEVPDYATKDSIEIRELEQADGPESPSREIAPANQEVGERAEFRRIERDRYALGAELMLNDPDIFPIKRYAQYEDKITRTAADPLAGLTSVLAWLPHADDWAGMQIVVRPIVSEAWRIRATKCARILGKNIFFGIDRLQKLYAYAFMTRKLWPRIVFFPVYIFFFFQGLMAGTKVTLSIEASGGDVLEELSSRVHEKESSGDAMIDKVVKLVFECSIRVLYMPSQSDPKAALVKVRELAGGFKQFNQPHLNGFGIAEIKSQEIVDRYRQRALHESFVLNAEELATIFHMPTIQVKTPNVSWVTSVKLEPPLNLPDPKREQSVTALGSTTYRSRSKLFGIRTEDRRRHIYVIGKTGMGKSTLLENMIVSDIRSGKGVAVVDPHGDLADHILDQIPSSRTNDVIVFDPSDREHPVAFNMLENIDSEMNTVVASGLVGIFKKIYAESWGPRLEHILRNTILSLLEYPNTTMLGIPRILADDDFRRRVVRKIQDPIVRKFWSDEFDKMQEKFRTEAIAPIQNKVGQFLSSPIIRNIVGQPKSMIDLRYAMDNRKIFICNLSKGKIGEDNSSLLGSMIITKFQLDAMSRSNIPEKDRVDFYLYVDEFQNFATDSFATILSEARKYRLCLTMANQYVAQMSEEVRDAVFGNVGTLMSFQVGFDDAELISQQYSEIALPADLVQLPKYNLYTKLLVDGMPTLPFSAATLAPETGEADPNRREKVMKLSRERYSKPRALVEDRISRWSADSESEEAEPAKKTPAFAKSEKPMLSKSAPAQANQPATTAKAETPPVKPKAPAESDQATATSSATVSTEVNGSIKEAEPTIQSAPVAPMPKIAVVTQPTAPRSESHKAKPDNHAAHQKSAGHKPSGYKLPPIKPAHGKAPIDTKR